MNDARKEIHLKRSTVTIDIFGYMNLNDSDQVALVTVDTAQFDLAYVDVDGEEILGAFDSCSSTTLVHKELIEEGRIVVEETRER